MNKFINMVILIDTANKVAYDLTLLSENLISAFGGSDIIESIDLVAKETAFNLLQVAVNKDESQEDFLIDAAFDVCILSSIKKEANFDPEMYTELSRVLEAV